MKIELKKTEVFLRNDFVPFAQANLSIGSSPVLYGLSIYTVFGAIWDEPASQMRIFRLRDHYDRLINSAKVLDLANFQQDWNYERFAQTMHELLVRNHVQEEVLVRATVFVDEIAAGTRTNGLANSFSAYVSPFGKIMPVSGVHLGVSSWQRNADTALPPRLKANGGYVNATLMKNEALANGYDDAIALNSRGQVSEGTVANIFLVIDGQLVTPDASSDLLVGITRDTVFRLADYLKIPYIERPVERSELYEADEAFFCGSSANITPILSIDKRPVAGRTAGPLTRQLSEAYENVRYGKNPDFSSWLTEVKV